MSEKKVTIADKVLEIARPVADNLGLSIWDVFYGKEGQDKILRITIDKEGGIFISDCEELSRAVDPLIDEAEVISEAYRFEVSSPGLGRRIHTDAQFEAYVGKSIVVKLIREDENGTRDYTGILKAYNENSFVLTADEKDIEILRNAVSFVKADDDIDF